MTRLARISQAVHSTSDRKILALLNRAWWKEYFASKEVMGRNQAVKRMLKKFNKIEGDQYGENA